MYWANRRTRKKSCRLVRPRFRNRRNLRIRRVFNFTYLWYLLFIDVVHLTQPRADEGLVSYFRKMAGRRIEKRVKLKSHRRIWAIRHQPWRVILKRLHERRWFLELWSEIRRRDTRDQTPNAQGPEQRESMECDLPGTRNGTYEIQNIARKTNYRGLVKFENVVYVWKINKKQIKTEWALLHTHMVTFTRGRS